MAKSHIFPVHMEPCHLGLVKREDFSCLRGVTPPENKTRRCFCKMSASQRLVTYSGAALQHISASSSCGQREHEVTCGPVSLEPVFPPSCMLPL